MSFENFNLISGSKIDPLPGLEEALKGLYSRNKAITVNIANANTPGYRRREVNFEDALKKKMDEQYSDIHLSRTNNKHIANQVYKLNGYAYEEDIATQGGSFEMNGNNVDIDKEMVDLAATGMRFRAVAEITKKHFDGMRAIVQGL